MTHPANMDTVEIPSKPYSESLDRKTMMILAGIGMLIGLAVPALAYQYLTEVVPPISEAADRIAFALPWMCLPVLALIAGMGAIGMGRLPSEYADGSTPPPGTNLEMHRRYMQNTVEQLLIFIPTQLALVTILPDDRLALIPAWSILFLVARITFWIGYMKNPMYRSLGMMMVAPNQFATIYVLFHAIM